MAYDMLSSIQHDAYVKPKEGNTCSVTNLFKPFFLYKINTTIPFHNCWSWLVGGWVEVYLWVDDVEDDMF